MVCNQHPAPRCGRCHGILSTKAAYVYDNSVTCTCPTGGCTCRDSWDWWCPKCEPNPSPTFIFINSKNPSEEDQLKPLPTGAAWLGDKLSNQRDRSRWKAKSSIAHLKRVWKPK